MAFCIIGSCVSRDIWERADRPYNGKYFARTSFASLTSGAVKLKAVDLDSLSSPFQKSCIIADAYNQWLDWILDNKPDEIIVDFIDERFDLIETTEGILSNSFELHESKVIPTKYPEARIIEKNSTEGFLLWEKGFRLFMKTVNENLPDTKFILHKAWFQTHIENVGPWDRGVNIPRRTMPIEDLNDLLKDMYDVANEYSIHTIEAANHNQISANEHKWGRSPVHYVEEYYTDCWKQISPLIS